MTTSGKFSTIIRRKNLDLYAKSGKKLAKYGKNQINGLENGLEKSKNVTKIVVD